MGKRNKYLQCNTVNCTCSGTMIHLRDDTVGSSKRVKKAGCKAWTKCQCHQCLGLPKKDAVIATKHKSGHKYYQCGEESCTRKGRKTTMMLSHDGLLYCTLHYKLHKQQIVDGDEQMPPPDAVKV